MKKLSKKELIALAVKNGFFKKKAVKEMYGRENGHFYYTKPPAFVDGLETFKITRKDVEGGNGSEDEVVYPMNAKDTAKAVKNCTSMEELNALVTEGKLLEEEARKGVLTALKEKNEELAS